MAASETRRSRPSEGTRFDQLGVVNVWYSPESM